MRKTMRFKGSAKLLFAFTLLIGGAWSAAARAETDAALKREWTSIIENSKEAPTPHMIAVYRERLADFIGALTVKGFSSTERQQLIKRQIDWAEIDVRNQTDGYPIIQSTLLATLGSVEQLANWGATRPAVLIASQTVETCLGWLNSPVKGRK